MILTKFIDLRTVGTKSQRRPVYMTPLKVITKIRNHSVSKNSSSGSIKPTIITARCNFVNVGQ